MFKKRLTAGVLHTLSGVCVRYAVHAHEQHIRNQPSHAAERGRRLHGHLLGIGARRRRGLHLRRRRVHGVHVGV